MKNKPLRHKETNTFKFQPFSERISSINIDVYHRVRHKYEQESEEETYFYQCLEKWTLLNCSESFQDLRKEITPNVHTLPQLLLIKDRVIDVLINHLEAKNALSLQSTLELTVALAKDLRQEFYPYFDKFLSCLISVLNTKDTDQLEWTFECLAYLFKFLWRYLVNNLPTVFESLLPLFSNSKPYYINNFAAESFAFVARKVKDQTKFIKLVLHFLKKFSDGVSGCGRLLFEIIHGVPGQFHSCAESTLTALFNSLNDEAFPYTLLCEVIDHTVSNMVKCIQPKHSQLFWKILLDFMKTWHCQWKQSKQERNAKNLLQALKIVNQAVSHKSCALVVEPGGLLRILLTLLDQDEHIDTGITQLNTDLLTTLLLSPSLHLTQEQSSEIINSALKNLTGESLVHFISSVFSYVSFEGLVLPRLITFCKTQSPMMMLPLLAELILHKVQPAITADELLQWTPYTLDFANSKNGGHYELPDFLFNLLSIESPEICLQKTDLIKCSLIIIPHIVPINKPTAIEKLSNFILVLLKALGEGDSPLRNSVEKILLILDLLSTSMESVIHLKPDNLTELIEPELVVEVLLPFATDPKYICALRTLNFFICSDVMNTVAPFADRIKNEILVNLLSPQHKIRLLSTHTLYELEKSNVNIRKKEVFLTEYCWKSEKTPASLQEYREKLKYIQKLDCTETLREGILKDEIDFKLPLSYLIGSLYINFKLIWDPVIKIIVSYAHSLKPVQFWSVFGPQLQFVAERIKEGDNGITMPSYYQFDFLKKSYEYLNSLDDKADHINFRILLWKTMEDCPEVCELKNRDLVTQFLLFLEEEYFKRNADQAKTWDITLKNNEETSILIDDEMKMEVDFQVKNGNEGIENSESDEILKDAEKADESLIHIERAECDEQQIDVEKSSELLENLENADTQLKEIEEIKKALTEPVPDLNFKYRLATKSLLGHLKVFAKLRAPKSMHREAELRGIYYDFLSHKLADVQKCALDCLMTYKYKYLTPYKEHLYALIDDKTFKNEISLFRIDKDTDAVRPEHRSDLIPIVLRIAYSKMYSQIGTKSGGSSKNSVHARRAAVIKFLAGCSGEELEKFFHMSFRHLADKMRDDPLSLVDSILTNLDLEHSIPPKRLYSSVNLLNTLLIYCGGLLNPELLNYLLRVLLMHGAIIVQVLESRDKVHPGYVKMMKNIRSICFEAIMRFFKNFHSYPWSAIEIDSVFKVFVWPWLVKLTMEGIHSPTPLLKLLSIWSMEPRFFPLLGKRLQEDGTSMSPISVMLELLLGPKTHNSVSNAIMDILERLLTLQIEEDDESPYELKVNGGVALNEEVMQGKNLNYGSMLLIPHIPQVLEKLRRTLLHGTKRGLIKRDLEIMSRITEFVSDPESSETLVELLCPILLKKGGAGEHVISPLLNTANNLVQNVLKPSKFVRKLSPLFNSVNGPGPRKLLFTFISNISRKDGSECSLDSDLLEDLNAWDSKWLDQPDFKRRLDAFKKLEKLTDDGCISVDMGAIVIYTCFHFLRTESDMSLRDNASYCLKKLCPSLSLKCKKGSSDLLYLINDVILILLKDGIRNKQNEQLRNEAIGILGCMARTCGELHPVLRDLSLLGNEADLEVDFFENLKHMQLHRKVRAMLKFSIIMKELDKAPNSRTLTQFILPLASHYLCSDKFSNKNTIVDSAIQVVGSVCQLLPWHQYLTILTYYLGKLQGGTNYQKQLVRINVQILNAFHFDLSRADLQSVEVQQTKDETKEATETPVENGTQGNDISSNEDPTTAEEAEDLELESKLEQDEKMQDEVPEVKILENSTLKAFEKQIVLSRSAALRVIQAITKKLLPQLNKSMAQRTQADTTHKVNRKMMGPDRDEEDILRVPLAVAVVQLLQKLPHGIMERNLPGILMKVCTFLKSRLESVRRVTRETLQTIMVSVGPEYLSILIHEMTPILNRGFHVHVLVYSVHSVLVALKPHFKQGDLSNCIHSILKICSTDLFGDTAEEKEVAQIAGKIMEARAKRSFDIYNILATFITENYLLDLILPLKEELSKTLAHKSVSKARECLQQVVLGLMENKLVSVESLLQFAYGVSSESIPALVKDLKEKPVDPKMKEFEARRPPDSFIIPEEPKRQRAVASKTCVRTNANILVEFGLRLLYFLLKREKLKDLDFRALLDPLVQLFADCLKSQHTKITTLSLQCLCWVLKLDLPSMKDRINEITQSLFSILHKYAASGLSKGDNFELVLATFKAVGVLVRDVKYHQLEKKQIHALLLYCEQDLHDHSRQVTAFTLLKAIIGRKIKANELNEVMLKVCKVSVTSNVESVRLQARQVVHKFLMDYPLGGKLESYLAFYFSQLNYDFQPGRESALELLKSLINSFPMSVLKEQSGLMYINIAASLVNDPTPECRKQAADIIMLLLTKVENDTRNQLFSITALWLEEKKMIQRRLAVQLIGIFITYEKAKFLPRVHSILPEISKQFNHDYNGNQPGKFVKAPVETSEELTEDKEKIQDHHLYQVLQMLVKLCTLCPKVLTENKYTEDLEVIADNAHSLLAHPHDWVRLGSVQLLGLIASAIPSSTITAAANSCDNEKPGFLLNNTRFRLKSLTLDLLAQLTPEETVNEKLLMQCMKLLVYLAEIFKGIAALRNKDDLSLTWLIKRIRKQINVEIVRAPSSTVVRRMAFSWMAAIALKFNDDILAPLSPMLLAPLLREMNTTEESNANLRQMAKEAAGYIKKKIGTDEYNSVITKLSSSMEIRKAERRKERAQLVVTDPERAAKRKINKQLKKKELKKRKIDLMKNQKFKRKRTAEEIDFENI